jgi:hypothetical protein
MPLIPAFSPEGEKVYGAWVPRVNAGKTMLSAEQHQPPKEVLGSLMFFGAWNFSGAWCLEFGA